jgi:hypothetical protein
MAGATSASPDWLCFMNSVGFCRLAREEDARDPIGVDPSSLDGALP